MNLLYFREKYASKNGDVRVVMKYNQRKTKIFVQFTVCFDRRCIGNWKISFPNTSSCYLGVSDIEVLHLKIIKLLNPFSQQS